MAEPTPFRLPRLSLGQILIDMATGKPSTQFQVWWQIFVQMIEKQEARQDTDIATLNELVATLTATQVAAQQAQASANAAQASTDAATGDAVSGDGGLTIDVPDATWVPGAQVDMTGLVAGTLTIAGSGPQQGPEAFISGTGKRVFNGEYRIVEVVGGVDEVLFTGTFTASMFSAEQETANITDSSTAAVAAFSSARTSTGAVSYRLDARRTGGSIALFSLDTRIAPRRTT